METVITPGILGLTQEAQADFESRIALLRHAEQGHYTEAGVMELVGLTSERLRYASANAEIRQATLDMVRAKVARAWFKLGREIIASLGRGFRSFQAAGNHQAIMRLWTLAKACPGITSVIPAISVAIEAHGYAVFSYELYNNTPEWEWLQLAFKKVRLTVGEEKPTSSIPADFIKVSAVTPDLVKEMIVAMGGIISESGANALIRGLRIKILPNGYVINERAEVRSTLVITRLFANQMLDPHAAMFILLACGDAGLLRSVSESDISENWFDRNFQGWFFVALAKMLAFKGSAMEDGVRKLVVKAKFQPVILSWGQYGIELDLSSQLGPDEVAERVFNVYPRSLVRDQAQNYFQADSLVDIVEDQATLKTLRDKLSAKDFEKFSKFLAGGKLLAAIGSSCKTKGLKRITQDKAGQMELPNMDISAVTFRHELAMGRMTRIAWAPDLIPEITGGLGALVSLRSRRYMKGFYAFQALATLTGIASDITLVAQREELYKSVPKVGDVVHEGDIIRGHNSLPIKVSKNQAGRVINVEAIGDGFGNMNWVITTQSKENRGQAKLRGMMKGMLCYPGIVRMRPWCDYLAHDMIHGSNFYIMGVEADIVVGMDGGKATGKGNAQFRVGLAGNTLRKLWTDKGLKWSLEVRKWVPESVLHEIDGRTYIDYSPLADLQGAYTRLVAEYERVAGVSAWVGRQLPSGDWGDLADKLGCDLGDATALDEDGYQGHLAITNLGGGFEGHTDHMAFLHYDDGDEFHIAQRTRVFESWDVAKVEATPVSVSASCFGSMPEVAYATAQSCPLFMQFMHDSGMPRATRVTHLARLLTLIRDEEGELTVNLDGSDWVRLDSPGLPWKRSVELNQATIENLDEASKKLIQSFIDRPLEEWDPGVLFVCQGHNGKEVAFDREALMSFARGTEISGSMEVVRSLLGLAVQGNWRTFSGRSLRLLGQLKSMFEGDGVLKQLHKGADAIAGKQVAVFATREEDHFYCFLNKHGCQAGKLARRFACPLSELVGKTVVYYRGPQFIWIALTIKFDSRVGPDEIGVTSRVASLSWSDFDGDGPAVIAITDPSVEAEVKTFDSYAFAQRVHDFALTGETHWLAANDFALEVGKGKDRWAAPKLTTMDDLHEMGIEGIRALRHDMSGDSNKAHLTLVESSFGYEGWVFSDLEAQTMLLHVYEPQLAGYDPAWRTAHVILQERFNPEIHEDYESFLGDKLDKLVAHCTAELGLTEKAAETLFAADTAMHRYTTLEKANSPLVSVDTETAVIVTNYVHGGMDLPQRSELLWAVIAGAVKRLAQGACNMVEFSCLLKDLDKMTIVSVTKEKGEDGEVVESIFVADGKPEVFHVMSRVRLLANKGNFGCLRLVYFVDNVLPLLNVLYTKPQTEEDYSE